MSERTLQRWTAGGELKADGRPEAIRPEPANKLSPAERQRLVTVSNEPRFASLPPSQIVPQLADEGVYLASESTFYRVLHEVGQVQGRGRAQAPRKVALPTSHRATAADQVWTWDITYLPSPVQGQYCQRRLKTDPLLA